MGPALGSSGMRWRGGSCPGLVRDEVEGWVLPWAELLFPCSLSELFHLIIVRGDRGKRPKTN